LVERSARHAQLLQLVDEGHHGLVRIDHDQCLFLQFRLQKAIPIGPSSLQKGASPRAHFNTIPCSGRGEAALRESRSAPSPCPPATVQTCAGHLAGRDTAPHFAESGDGSQCICLKPARGIRGSHGIDRNLSAKREHAMCRIAMKRYLGAGAAS
jgi:hypothetical protein